MNRINKLIINLTTKCNLNCDYCIVKKSNLTIDKKKLDTAISFIKNNKFKKVKFFGGEPLLEFSKIKYLVDNISNDQLNYEVVTNGSFLNQKRSTFFKKNKFKINLSFDFEFKKQENKLIYFEKYDKTYLNIMLLPNKLDLVMKFVILNYKRGIKKFNFLPIYYKYKRSDSDLAKLDNLFKKLAIFKITKKDIFYEGINDSSNQLSDDDSIFLDTDGCLYLTDLVTNLDQYGGSLKEDLFLGRLGENFTIKFKKDYKNRIIYNYLEIQRNDKLNLTVDKLSFYIKKFS